MPTLSPKDSGRPSPRALGTTPSGLEAPSWRRVARINLIRREIRESLSPNALELLFGGADLVVEAGEDPAGSAVYATVMVTLDLSRTAQITREPSDAETARRLGQLMAADKGVKLRLKKLARPYLCEAAGTSVALGKVEVEFKVRNEGKRILIDADAMVSLSAAGQGARG